MADLRDFHVASAQADGQAAIEERWAQCAAPYGAYSVSNKGRVKKGKKGKKGKERMMSVCKNKDGYEIVKLTRTGPGGQKSLGVARLMMEAFAGGDRRPPGHDTVDHKNRVRDHNDRDNTRWATRAQQQANRVVPFRPEVRSGRAVMSTMQMRHLSYACQRTARPAFELKLCARSDRGQDPVDERCSATNAFRRTHASVAAAADALGMSPEAVVDAIAERTALASGIKLAWCTCDSPGLGRWMPVTRANVFAAGGKSAPAAPAAGVRPYHSTTGALLDCLPAERCSPFA